MANWQLIRGARDVGRAKIYDPVRFQGWIRSMFRGLDRMDERYWRNSLYHRSAAQKAIIQSTPEVLGTTPEVNETIIPLLERLNLPVDAYRQYFMEPSASGAITATQPEVTLPTTINEAAEQSVTAAPEGSLSLKVEDLFSTL